MYLGNDTHHRPAEQFVPHVVSESPSIEVELLFPGQSESLCLYGGKEVEEQVYNIFKQLVAFYVIMTMLQSIWK